MNSCNAWLQRIITLLIIIICMLAFGAWPTLMVAGALWGICAVFYCIGRLKGVYD